MRKNTTQQNLWKDSLMLNKKNYISNALFIGICAGALLFYSCAKEKKMSQDDFMSDVREKIAQSPNDLNAKFTANCEPEHSDQIAFKILNEEVFTLRCSLNEYDFFSSSINPKQLSRTQFLINAGEPFVANVVFRKGFPKHGVALRLLCLGDGKAFRDIQLITCPT